MVTAPVEVRRFQPFSALETDLSTTLSLSGVAPCSNFLVVFFNTGVTHGYPTHPIGSFQGPRFRATIAILDSVS